MLFIWFPFDCPLGYIRIRMSCMGNLNHRRTENYDRIYPKTSHENYIFRYGLPLSTAKIRTLGNQESRLWWLNDLYEAKRYMFYMILIVNNYSFGWCIVWESRVPINEGFNILMYGPLTNCLPRSEWMVLWTVILMIPFLSVTVFHGCYSYQ